jgi:ABC-type enterochelin transport system substrate-binding protein
MHKLLIPSIFLLLITACSPSENQKATDEKEKQDSADAAMASNKAKKDSIDTAVVKTKVGLDTSASHKH